MTRLEAIATAKEWIEYAPPASNTAKDLAGWRGLIVVCASCASRILGRGCNLRMLADEPVWSPDSLTCDVCGEQR